MKCDVLVTYFILFLLNCFTAHILQIRRGTGCSWLRRGTGCSWLVQASLWILEAVSGTFSYLILSYLILCYLTNSAWYFTHVDFWPSWRVLFIILCLFFVSFHVLDFLSTRLVKSSSQWLNLNELSLPVGKLGIITCK